MTMLRLAFCFMHKTVAVPTWTGSVGPCVQYVTIHVNPLRTSETHSIFPCSKPTVFVQNYYRTNIRPPEGGRILVYGGGVEIGRILI